MNDEVDEEGGEKVNFILNNKNVSFAVDRRTSVPVNLTRDSDFCEFTSVNLNGHLCAQFIIS